MKTRKVKVSFVADRSVIQAVVALVINDISELHVEDLADDAADAPVKKREHKPQGNGEGKPRVPYKPSENSLKVVAAIKARIAANPEKDYRYTEFADILTQHGMSPTSATPILSYMARNGDVVRVGGSRGVYGYVKPNK